MNKTNIDDRVEIEVVDNIAHVYLNRAEKHNALDMRMFNAIKNAIKMLRMDKALRVVVVEGKGEDFCTGLDVKSVMNSVSAPLKLLFKWTPWQSNLAQFVSTGWQTIPVPVIMVVHGRCWGGGLQVALGGDFRIAQPDSSISIMEARWGLIPDMGGSLALRGLVNQDIAKQLAMTGEIICGETAQKYGLVTHLDEKPIEKAMELAHTIAQQSPDAIAAAKKLYNKSWWNKPGFALAIESYYQIRILSGKNSKIKAYNQTHDAKESKKFNDRKGW